MPNMDDALGVVRRTNDELHAARRQAETKQARRDRAVRRAHEAGASLQVIADVLGCNRQYVHAIVQDRARRA